LILRRIDLFKVFFKEDSFVAMQTYTKRRQWLIKGDPTEGALVVAAIKSGLRIHEARLETRDRRDPFQFRAKTHDDHPSDAGG